MNEIQCRFVDSKLNELLENRCIVRKSKFDPSGFLSNIFLVPKKEENKFRLILNLRELNKQVVVPHFRMESLKDVQRLVHVGAFLGTCDIKDAYPHLMARLDQQSLLQFRWRGKYFAFCTMPQGLSNAPYVFTRICRKVAGYLRNRGVFCVFYIDDIIIVGSSFEQCQKNIELVVSTLQKCGFIINFAKSQLIPAQTATVLGFLIDANEQSIVLEAKKQSALVKTFQTALSLKTVKIRVFAKWIGLCISILPCFPEGRLRYRNLEHAKLQALRARGFRWDKTMPVTSADHVTLAWWLKTITHNKPHMFAMVPISLTLWSDASLQGWGIALDSGERTGFRFSK